MLSRIRVIQKKVKDGTSIEDIVKGYLGVIEKKDGGANPPAPCRDNQEIEEADEKEWAELLKAVEEKKKEEEEESEAIESVVPESIEALKRAQARMLKKANDNVRPIFEALAGMPPTVAVIIAISQLTSRNESQTGVEDAQPYIDIVKEELEKLEKEFPGQLEKLREAASKNRPIHAFLRIFNKDALKQARDLDERLRRGERLPLAGVTLAVKDLMAFKKTTAASKILEDYVAPDDYVATAVKRLVEEGAIVIGKTNLDEFALGSSNESTAFWPAPRNPLDRTKVPGGSSGGSAAAVQAEMAVAALGSDTAGSIRVPASYCGIVGVKPTYGLVSRHGLFALASSLDCVGPITTSVEDAAILLGYMVGPGPDGLDQTVRYPASLREADEPEAVYARTLGQDGTWKTALEGMQVGIPIEYFFDLDLDDHKDKDYQKLSKDLLKEGSFDFSKLKDSKVRTKMRLSGVFIDKFLSWMREEKGIDPDLDRDAIERYWREYQETDKYKKLHETSIFDKFRQCPGYWKKFGTLLEKLQSEYKIQFKFVSLPHTWLSIPSYFVMSRAELASNLHRFDGLKYGRKSEPITIKYQPSAARNRLKYFGRQPKQRILMGINMLLEKNKELLRRSMQARHLIREDFTKEFEKGGCDLLLSPTVNTFAPEFGGFADTVTQQQMDQFSVPANHAGVPAISVPLYRKDNLFQSAQVIAPEFEEEKMFQLATAVEAVAHKYMGVKIT